MVTEGGDVAVCLGDGEGDDAVCKGDVVGLIGDGDGRGELGCGGVGQEEGEGEEQGAHDGGDLSRGWMLINAHGLRGWRARLLSGYAGNILQ